MYWGKIPNYLVAVTKLARKYATSGSNLITRSAKNQFGVKGFHELIKVKITEPFEVTNYTKKIEVGRSFVQRKV